MRPLIEPLLVLGHDVCIYVCIYVCVYVCTTVCMYIYMYVCVYVCMYVSVLLLIFITCYSSASSTPWTPMEPHWILDFLDSSESSLWLPYPRSFCLMRPGLFLVHPLLKCSQYLPDTQELVLSECASLMACTFVLG